MQSIVVRALAVILLALPGVALAMTWALGAPGAAGEDTIFGPYALIHDPIRIPGKR